ncbi:hypothetical protein DFAR_3530014 [Desulfarculales bacterium]
MRLGRPRSSWRFWALAGLTFAEATWTQGLPDLIGSHQRGVKFFGGGGGPEVTVIDNLKSGGSKACRCEPDINPAYLEMAAH